MFKDITIGQYVDADSKIHSLDPRTKIIGVGIFMIMIFMLKSLYQYIPVFIGLMAVVALAKIPPMMIIKGIMPLKFIIILTFVINALTGTGKELYSFWIFTLTDQGLLRASFMALRLIFLVMGTSVLTLTTSPTQLTDGLENLLSPLARFGFPAHELAMMMTIALRFIPTLIEETDKIMKAQMARGADFESGNLIKRAQNLVPLLVPLFINSLRRASELAVAMESRCYRGGEGRTRLKELAYRRRDLAALGILLIFSIGLVALGRIYL